MSIWILFAVIIIIFGFIFILFSRKEVCRLKLKCPKCGSIFTHSFNPVLILFFTPFIFQHFLDVIYNKHRFFLRCPKCRKFSWCSLVEDLKDKDSK